jgi:hypothetical protein
MLGWTHHRLEALSPASNIRYERGDWGFALAEIEDEPDKAIHC